MRDETFIQGLKLIETLSEVTKGEKHRPFTEQQAMLYRTLLDDIPDELFVKGITELLKSRVFANLPTPAEIREFCLGLKEDQLQAKVMDAKLKIKEALGRVGTYSSVVFDDPVIHLAIRDLGGWTKLGKMDMEDFENYLKWDFPKVYKAYASRKNTEIPTILIGVAQDEKDIVYIGNAEKAKKWIIAYENKQLGYLETLQIERKKHLNEQDLIEWLNN